MAENQTSSPVANTEEKISPLNYSAHAIDDLLNAAGHVPPHLAGTREAFVETARLLERAVKFILPNCADLLDADSVGQAHLDLLRIPYPVTALEIPWQVDHSVDTIGGVEQQYSSRRIALCWEPEATPPAWELLNTIKTKAPQGGVFVLPIFWADEQRVWSMGLGGVFIPYHNTFAPLAEKPDNPLSLRAAEALMNVGLANSKSQTFKSEPFIVQHEQFNSMFARDRNSGFYTISMDSRDEAVSLIKACSVLNCENVNTAEIAPNAKLNKARLAKGKQPFFSYKVLALSDDHGNSNGDALGGSHASPRMHLRRGHIRRLKHKSVWVRSAIVGAGSKGMAIKEYSVRPSRRS